MDIRTLERELREKVKKDPYGYDGYEGYYNVCRLMLKEDHDVGIEDLRWLSGSIDEAMPTMAQMGGAAVGALYGLHRKVLLAAAPWDFDSYIRFVEWNRQPEKKFYEPDRKSTRLNSSHHA